MPNLPPFFRATFAAFRPLRFNRHEHLALVWTLLYGAWLGALVGLLSGSASALFLISLNAVTAFRESHSWLLWLLPLGGAGIGAIYQRFGQSVAGGNNLLLERIRKPDTPVPFRLAPLVLLTTLATHLFGGSAGREGTAVQMGGALAALVGRFLPHFDSPALDTKQDASDNSANAEAHAGDAMRSSLAVPSLTSLLLMAGMSGGFGSVFGTPLAGAVFGLEVLSVGRMGYEGLVPCFVASVVGDAACRAWGAKHPAYSVGVLPVLSPTVWLWIVMAGVVFGGAAWLFAELTETISHTMRGWVSRPWLRPVWGGLAVIALTFLVGTRDYLGLSLPLLERSFTPGGVVLWAWALKLLFTSVTLGTGFKGGEVTPLFCIGAALGAAVAQVTGQSVPLFAALGFVAVFAGAANIPLTCTILGMELFGAGAGVPLAAVCLISYILSGHRGIYSGQLIGTTKSRSVLIPEGTTLGDLHDANVSVFLPFPSRRSGAARTGQEETPTKRNI